MSKKNQQSRREFKAHLEMDEDRLRYLCPKDETPLRLDSREGVILKAHCPACSMTYELRPHKEASA